MHYTCSKSITLHLMLSDGWGEPVEQLGRRSQLHVCESKVPTLKVVVEHGIAGGRCDDRGGVSGSVGGEETKCGRRWGWASRDIGVSLWDTEADITGPVGTIGTHGSRGVFDAF